MKFTCDSCGAQYLIADEKIGARGVKVRCKKCSHVIILRPTGFPEAATEKPQAEQGNGGPLTGGSASSVPVAPSVSSASSDSTPSMLPNDVLAATSSDLGLSQEFMALGFDEGNRSAPRAATLSVGLDLNGAPSTAGDSSPFSSERAGGSLDLVPASEATAVQARPDKPFADEETEMIPDPAAAAGDLSGPVGLGASLAPEMDDDEASTRVESLQDLASSELARGGDDPEVHEEEDETLAVPSGAHPFEGMQHEATEAAPALMDPAETPSNNDSAELGAALQAMQHDEMDDMRSSLADEMAGLSDELDGDAGAPKTEVGPSPRAHEASPEDHAAGALAALAEAEDEPSSDDAADEAGLGDGLVITGAAAAADAVLPGEGDVAGEDSIADEIGSAFEAMFAGGEAPESELDAIQQALAEDGQHNKAETRVFDTEAMAKVEAEQDRAGVGVEPEAPEAKEWYVAIEEEQVGPLSKSEVKAHWDNGDLEPGSLCWRAGMGDWTAIKDTAPLSEFVPPEPEPRVPTVIGGDAPSEDTPLEAEAPEAEGEAAAAVVDPPKIQPEPDPEPAPRAASEPAWRPSAASALASLAAEELSSGPEPAATPSAAAPLGAAPAGESLGALPASDALEKLLEGEPDKSAASQFGAAEKSESYVRPLPRRADTVSSLPLRDPTQDKAKTNWAIPAAILGGFLLLGLLVIGGMMLNRDDDKTPEPGSAQLAAVASPGLVNTPPAGAEAAKAAAEAKAAEEKAAAEAKAAEEKAAAEAKAAEEKAAAEAKAAEEKAKAAKKSTRRRRGRRRSPSRTTSRAVTAAREPAPELRAAPPPPPKRSGSTEDDLLGAAAPARKRPTVAPEPDLPEQLDDSDVFGVLRSHKNDVKRCLKAQASADPSLEGTMTVELLIRRSGRPKSVRIREDRFKRAAVGTCMVAAVKRWRFPKFSGKAMPVDFPVRVRASR